MKELIDSGLAFVIIAVVLVIGSGIVVMTNTAVADVVGNSTLLDTIVDNVGSALTTFTSLLPILGLTVVGGLRCQVLAHRPSPCVCDGILGQGKRVNNFSSIA
jgi:hypothetical protein